MRCAVYGCNNDNQSKKFSHNVKFYRFPKNNSIRKQWVTACTRQDTFNANTARVCSQHFNNDSYERNLMYELTNRIPKQGLKLKHDAVPFLNLAKSKTLHSSQIQRRERCNKRSEKKYVNELVLQNSKEENPVMYIDTEKSISNQSTSETTVTNAIVVNNEDLSSSLSETSNWTKDLENLKQENSMLKQKIAQLEEKLSAVEKLFTSRQIKKLQNPKKRLLWSAEDISQAIAIRSAGPKSYRLLIKKGYPFPAVSTLKSWIKKIKIVPGIIKPVMNIIKKTDLTDWEKICVLSFDEMKIRKAYAYDRINDELISPCNYAQVIMMRGIVGSWKQPIFFDFDRKLDNKLLFEIMEYVENAGFYVCAIVSDLGGTNRGLHKTLQVTMDNPSFDFNDHKVYVFADAPHLLKLLRNHFLDYGFVTNESEINKDIVKNLLHFTNGSDVRITYKLTEEMLAVTGPQRQKVKFAAKLFSHTVSQAINRCGTLGYFQNSTNWVDCAEFFKLVNDWFDVLNVRVPQSDSRKRLKGYGSELTIQNKILDEMSNTMLLMRVKGKKTLLPFQKGVIQTNNALKGLFLDLKEKYDLKYLLTYRLNQDVLENFFGQVRRAGGLYDHPDVLEFQYRVRNYVLGRNEEAIVEGGNTEVNDENNSLGHIGEILLSKPCFDDLYERFESSKEDVECEIDQLKYDAIEHVTGFICHKLKIIEKKNTESTDTFTWTDQLSEGGLIQPPPKLLQSTLQLENIFNSVNGKYTLKPGRSYMSNLLDQSSTVDCEKNVKLLYFKSRMYFRIKDLNYKIKEDIRCRKRKLTKTIQ